jgi:chemotaxis protein CheX
MDVRYINPFVDAVSTVFKTMLELEPQRQPLKLSPSASDQGSESLTSIIGISGQIHGVVALRFPPDSALCFAERLLGTKLDNLNEEVIDAAAELANMVAGSAKAQFEFEPPLDLGLPTVVQGTGYRLKYPSGSSWLQVPFQTECGSFLMEVSYAE